MPSPNRLAQEQSPYLLQHKDNPVDWYPWGEEAFEKARREDKPIFLSIGYSTCHWCHVMERESFEDEDVARLMNDTFVPIKVDREERPDIDSIYMTVCQLMTGRGGWPLTILMTPEKKPFYAATYLPKEGRFGQMGMMDLIPRVAMTWEQARDRVEEQAGHLTETLQRAAAHGAPGEVPGEEALHRAFQQLRRRYDATHGGFGQAPKFPAPHHLLFLLRYGRRTGDAEAHAMVTHTLDQMRFGGIYDHIGYGFHRYSTDERWLLPHFEKMLYDQAGLAVAYTEAYQVTNHADYAQTAREIFTYVLRDMTSPKGGFYSAEDADSEGQEGKFYMWSTDEVRAVLAPEAAELFIQAYHLTEQGNFVEEASRQRTGENIPHLTQPLSELAQAEGVPEDELRQRLERARQVLFEHREQRVHPGKDDKILTDWNGYLIAALAKAARSLGEPAYAEAARRAVDFVFNHLRRDDGRLLHRYRGGEAGILANLDDHAFFIWGLIELYQTTFDVELLRRARTLTDDLITHFWDEEHGAFFFTPDDGEALIVRQKETYDAAMPSGNAVALLNLLRLARLTGATVLEEYAQATAAFVAPQVAEQPSGFTALLQGIDFAIGPAQEIVIAGVPGAEDTQAMLEAVRSRYLPNAVVLLRPADEEKPAIAEVAPFVEAQRARDGRATAYVCEHFECQAPTTDVDQLLRQLP